MVKRRRAERLPTPEAALPPKWTSFPPTPLSSFDLGNMDFEQRDRARVLDWERRQAWEREQLMAQREHLMAQVLASLVEAQTKARPGPKGKAPLKQLAIEAAMSLRADGKRVTAPAVRRRMQINGKAAPCSNRAIQNWIRPFRK